jgi:hypothetical protein
MRFPALSGRPAIFQVFFGLATSVEHFGHFAMLFFPPYYSFHAFIIME